MTEKIEKRKRFLTRDDLTSLGITYSNSHQIRLEADGLFPKRCYLSPQKVVWLLDEIEAWIVHQTAKRGGTDNA